jgi:hypothetical protein
MATSPSIDRFALAANLYVGLTSHLDGTVRSYPTKENLHHFALEALRRADIFLEAMSGVSPSS